MPASRLRKAAIEALGKISPRASIAAGLGLLVVVAMVDWVTGPEIALSITYLAPIALVTWRASRWPGLGMALLCGITWLGVELAGNQTYTNPVIPFWNALARTIFFSLVSGLMAEVLERKRVEKSLRDSQELLEQRARRLLESEVDLQKHTNILQSILNSMGDGVLVTDSQGRLVLMNPAAKLMLRIAATNDEARTRLAFEELCRTASAAAPPDRGNPLSRALRGEAVDGAEMFLQHPPASEGTWLSITGRPLMDQTGKISGEVIVFSDVTARKDLERRLAEVSDREQRRIGEDLHDGLCQQLVGAAFAARRLAARLSDLSLRETDDAAKLAGLLGDSIAQARDVARGLYLVQLEADGLNSALEELATQVRSRHALDCQFIDQSPAATVDETIATSLFRIAQEAVNNSLKHSQASQITITLAGDQDQLRLAIEDDGTGLPANYGSTGGIGLQIMNYRARMIGATLTLRPRPGGGTVVGCQVRLPNLSERTTHDPEN